jgi:hypothetical protein
MKKILLSGMALTLLLVACGEEEEGITPPRPPKNPIVEILVWVEAAFNQRNITYLKDNLHGDFVFYFDPDDVGQSPPGSNYVIPESWEYTVFWQACQNLFEKAFSISLSIPTGGVGTPAPNQTTYKVENINVKLLVMPDEHYGYLADTGYCNFAFERYENEKGEKFWRFTTWWDYTSVTGDAAPGLEPTSLGRILALYK